MLENVIGFSNEVVRDYDLKHYVMEKRTQRSQRAKKSKSPNK